MSNRWKGIGSGLALFVGLIAFGFALGGFLGGRVFTNSDMGWDRLANALGGVALGALGGAGLAGYLLTRLTPMRRLVVGTLALIGGVVFLTVLRALAG